MQNIASFFMPHVQCLNFSYKVIDNMIAGA